LVHDPDTHDVVIALLDLLFAFYLSSFQVSRKDLESFNPDAQTVQ
jgi:hypothetical protein